MAETLKLDDLSVGDQTTYESASSPNGLPGIYVSGGIDLGALVTLDEIRITAYALSSGGYNLAYSLNDITYIQIVEQFPGWIGFQSFSESFPDISARYIRATAIDQSGTDDPVEARLSDFRLYSNGSPVTPSPCNPAHARNDLPRTVWRGFDCEGAVGPSVDEWEIYRCDVLIDSGSLGGYGLAGWSVRRSGSGSGSDYDIFAPSTAAILDGYQARIDGGASHGDCSINFNVIDSGDDSMSCNSDRPFVYERWTFGRENSCGTPVIPNRFSIPMRMAPPNAVEPGTLVYEQGGLAAADIISQKGHTETSISGQMDYNSIVYLMASLGRQPLFKPVQGASVAKDATVRLRGKQDDPYDTWTVEAGQEAYPSRFAAAALLSGTFAFGKTENTFEGAVMGRRLDETVGGFTGTPGVGNLAEIPAVYVAPKDNAHYIGTASWNLFDPANLVCEVETVTLTVGQRRAPHFNQCPNETSFSDYVAQQEDSMISLQLSHKSKSRGWLTELRERRNTLYYGYRNTGPQIEPGFNYELEVTIPIKFESRTGVGENDLVTAATYQARPLQRSDFNPSNIGTPGGYMEVRIRAPFTALPNAQTL